MDHERYARFLPDEIRARLTVEPESIWWDWRDMRVHVARARRSDADFRVLALHGGGGHSELVWPLAALVAQEGVDVAAVDLPLYGRTEVPDRSSVTYPDWIDLLCDFVDAEDDGRPLIVFGASMGGMIAYETAARTSKADKVIATCLLDPTDPEARAAASRFSWTGKPAPKLLRAAAAVAGGISVPISLVADVRAMSRNPALSAQCLSDPRGAGTRVPIGWLASFMNYRHTPPERFSDTPVLLVHPAADSWTPPELSVRFLNRIAAPTEAVLLENCGHFPVEQPGLDQLESALRASTTL